MLVSNRATNILLVLVLAAGIAVVAMLASGVRGGPLDPPAAPGSTNGVRLPGTAIAPPVSPATYPIVLSTPGHYYLTAPLTPPADTGAIRISASDVSLDLGGFTLTGSGTTAVPGILVFGAQQHIEITHGAVRSFPGDGISAAGTPYMLVDDVTVTGSVTGITLGSNGVVRNCNSSSNTQEGIRISGSFSTIEDCAISSNGYRGVSIQNGSGIVVARSQITNNNTSGLADGGITFNSMDGATIRDNDFSGNAPYDFFLNFTSDNNVLINNTLTCPTAFIDSGSGNVFPMNTTDPGTNHTHKPAC